MNRLHAWADQVLAYWLHSVVELPKPEPRVTRKRTRVFGHHNSSRDNAPRPDTPRKVEGFRVEPDEAKGFLIFDEQDRAVYSGTKSECEDWLDRRENCSF